MQKFELPQCCPKCKAKLWRQTKRADVQYAQCSDSLLCGKRFKFNFITGEMLEFAPRDKSCKPKVEAVWVDRKRRSLILKYGDQCALHVLMWAKVNRPKPMPRKLTQTKHLPASVIVAAIERRTLIRKQVRKTLDDLADAKNFKMATREIWD